MLKGKFFTLITDKKLTIFILLVVAITLLGGCSYFTKEEVLRVVDEAIDEVSEMNYKLNELEEDVGEIEEDIEELDERVSVLENEALLTRFRFQLLKLTP